MDPVDVDFESSNDVSLVLKTARKKDMLKSVSTIIRRHNYQTL